MEMQFSEEQYQILDLVPLGQIILDREFKILFWNRRLEEWSGILREKVLGKSIIDLYPHLKDVKYYSRMKMMFEGGPPIVFSAQLQKYFLPIKSSQGDLCLQQTMINAIKRTQEKVEWALITIQDVTDPLTRLKEYRVMRNELELVNKELDAFAHTVSHDLRAPLRLTTACIKFLQNDHSQALNAEGKNYLERIEKGTVRLQTMIDDLLKLSRINRIRNPYEVTDMRKLIQSVVERLEYDIEENNVDIQIDSEMPKIQCDCIKMAEVFQNLINNAIKFSVRNKENTHPSIQIGHKPVSQGHLFFVKDNGIGIDKKYHDQVFELFRRTEESRDYEGTGAGLSIVKKVILDHGGEIWIESDIGRGASFNFIIPNFQSYAKTQVLSSEN